MGCDTKGFILTNCKHVLLVAEVVQRALDSLVRDEMRLVFPERSARFSKKAREAFRTTELRLMPNSGMVDIVFTFHGEPRSMKLFFTCDSDHVDFGPKSLSLMLGCAGRSDLFMKTVLHALSLFGPAFYDYNDCDSIEPAPLQEDAPSVLEAVSLGYISHTSLHAWWDFWQSSRGDINRAVDAQAFFGAPEEVIRELAERDDYTSAWDEFEAMAAKMNATPTFMAEYHQEVALRDQATKVAA